MSGKAALRDGSSTAQAWAGVSVLALLVALLAVPAAAVESPVESPAVDGRFERLAGADRYATAAMVAGSVVHGHGGAVVIARGDAFPDAVVAARVAGPTQAPILLTRPMELPAATLAALDTLEPTRAVVVGGEAAVGAPVVAALRDRGIEVERLGGSDRYATAAALALAGDPEAPMEIDGRRTAILASGTTFADALAAGPLAYLAGVPVLLTPPDALHPAAAATLAELRVEQVLIAGGEAAVGAAVAAALDGLEVQRVAGADRTGTAAAFAELALSTGLFAPQTLLLVRGDDYADALVAAAHAGRFRSPLVLTRTPEIVGQELLRHVEAHARAVRRIVVLGGTAAITERALNEVAGALDAGAGRGSAAVAYATPQGLRVADRDGTLLRIFEPSDEYSLTEDRLAMVMPIVAAGSTPLSAQEHGGNVPDYPSKVFNVMTGAELAMVSNARFPIIGGERVFFAPDHYGQRDETFTTLWVRDADGSERALATMPLEPVPGHPTDGAFLSAAVDEAGERLVFAWGNDVTLFFYDVWSVDVATGALTRLTFDAASRRPAISPDGERVVVVQEGESCTGAEEGPFASRLVILPAEGGDPSVLAPGDCDLVWLGPSWASDTEVLAPLLRPAADPENPGGWDAELVVIDVTTGAQRTIADDPFGAVSVSPSAGLAAYESERTADEDGGFVLYDLATGEEIVFEHGWLPKVVGDRSW